MGNKTCNLAKSFLNNPLFHLKTLSGKNKSLKRVKTLQRINWCEQREIFMESHTFIRPTEHRTVDISKFLPRLDVLQ